MNDDRLKLSVLMPNYNDSASLREVIRAVCEQSRQPDEFIILDDGSTDNSVELISEMAAQYPMIRLVCNDGNKGVLYSCNRLIEEATGDIVCYVSANDIILPGFFEPAMKLLEEHPEAALCCTDLKIENVKTGEITELRKQWLPEPGFLSPSELARVCREGIPKQIQPYIFGPTCVYRPELFKAVGGFREDMKWLADWFTLEVLAFRHGICYVPEPCVIFRYGGSNWGGKIYEEASQTLVFRTAVPLLCSEQYRDVLPLFMEAREFTFFELRLAKKLHVMLGFLCNPRNWRHDYFALTWYCIREILELRWYNSGPSLIQNITHVGNLIALTGRRLYHVARGSALYSRDYVRNKGYAIYARTFAAYDRFRKRISGSEAN